MFYVRSPAEGGQESIAKGLSVLWLVMRFVLLLLNVVLRLNFNFAIATVTVHSGHSCFVCDCRTFV